MISWIAAAMAASPAELAAAAPEAREQLKTCEVVGCARRDAAEAAWLVAVDAYIDRGVADGALAATVRVLDPGLFRELPDVVRDAATEPLPWATRVGGVGEPEPVFHEAKAVKRVDPYAGEKRPWRDAVDLTIEVLDPDGRPVPHAEVRFDSERENHRVNHKTGQWTSSMLYLADGTEHFFRRDDRLTLEVFAAGYAYERQSVQISKRRRQRVTVTLAPRPLELPDDAPPMARDALAAWEKWRQAETVHTAKPSEQTWQALVDSRHDVAQHARSWMDAGGGDEARELCLMTAWPRYCGAGDPPKLPK